MGSLPRRAAGEFSRGEGGRGKGEGQMSRDKTKGKGQVSPPSG